MWSDESVEEDYMEEEEEEEVPIVGLVLFALHSSVQTTCGASSIVSQSTETLT